MQTYAGQAKNQTSSKSRNLFSMVLAKQLSIPLIFASLQYQIWDFSEIWNKMARPQNDFLVWGPI